MTQENGINLMYVSGGGGGTGSRDRTCDVRFSLFNVFRDFWRKEFVPAAVEEEAELVDL